MAGEIEQLLDNSSWDGQFWWPAREEVELMAKSKERSRSATGPNSAYSLGVGTRNRSARCWGHFFGRDFLVSKESVTRSSTNGVTVHCEYWVPARWAGSSAYPPQCWSREAEATSVQDPEPPCSARRIGFSLELRPCCWRGAEAWKGGCLRLRSRRASDAFAPPGTLLSPPPTWWSPERRFLPFCPKC